MAEEKKVELNAENLEGVAGGGLGPEVKVKTGDVGNTQTKGGGEKKGDTKGSTVKSDNIDIKVGEEQQAINVGRGNSVGGQVNISFGKK